MYKPSTLHILQPLPSYPPPQPLPITFPTPLSYEFQVVEFVDANDKITKVTLQVKVNEHDQYGNVTLEGTWFDAPRIKCKI
jgi:hypothetical protein